MASIYSIVYKPKAGTVATERGSHSLRVPVQRANLIAGHGIEGDLRGGGNPARQLNLLSREWLVAARAKGYKIEPGQFGEQIIVSGLAVEQPVAAAAHQRWRGFADAADAESRDERPITSWRVVRAKLCVLEWGLGQVLERSGHEKVAGSES